MHKKISFRYIIAAMAVLLFVGGVSIVQSEYSEERLRKIELEIKKLFAQIKGVDRMSKGYANLSEHRLPQKVTICGERVPLENKLVREKLEHEFYHTLSRHFALLMVFKRAPRYFPEIDEKLRSKGMPLDLKYLAVAESDLKPHAVSHAGAVGMWQFISATGKSFGLTVTKSIDDRRDIPLSTIAAMKYLKVLHKSLGSWPLAMAGYNAGGIRVRKATERQGVKSYFELALPRETERYVYRIIAAKIILENGARYGYDLERDEYYKPLIYDEVVITLKQDTSFLKIAKACGSYYKRLRELNPRYRTPTIPKGRRRIILPPGSRQSFIKNFKQ